MTAIKICGITNLNDARVAAEAGADLLGFIFYEPSPRYITPETARQIALDLRQMSDPPQLIGVFVNVAETTIRQTLQFCQLDAAQLHGEESPEFVSRFPQQAYKAIRPQSNVETEQLVQQYCPAIAAQSPNDAARLPSLLLDAYHPNLYGGTGEVADWGMAAKIAQQQRIMLAGSLTPENVAEAIRIVQPWGVDVSSGVEATKGQKEPAKLRAFIHQARQATKVEVG